MAMTSRKKHGLWTLAAIAAAAILYGLYWNILAGQFRAGIEHWAAERKAEGVEVAFSTLRIGGFPFKLDAVLSNPVISISDGVRSWTWQGPLMLMRARPWTPNRARVSVPGRHRIAIKDGARPLDLIADAGTLEMSLRFGDGGIIQAVVSARNVTLNKAASGKGSRVLGLTRAEISAARPGDGNEGLDVGFKANAITYPVAPVAGLGLKTERVGLEVEIKGEPPLNPNTETMAVWRDNGGTLEFNTLDLNHGPLKLAGDGTGALDKGLQPIGAFSLRVRGFRETLDRLETAGLIQPRPAALVKAVLDVLSRSQGTGDALGEDAEVKLPLSIQDGKFFIGPVPVAKIPPIRWPLGG